MELPPISSSVERRPTDEKIAAGARPRAARRSAPDEEATENATAARSASPSSRPAALPAALPDRARYLLRSLAERTTSLAGLGRKAGHSMQWVWRLANTAKTFSLEKVLVVLGQAEVPPRFYFEELVSDEAELDPAWVLRHFHESEHRAEPSARSAEAGRLLQRWRDNELKVEPGPRLLEDWLLDAGERRHADAEQVHAELDRRLAAQAGCESLTRGQLIDHGHMLALLAIIERRAGHRDQAIELLSAAFELAAPLEDDSLRGHLYGRASFLLSDLGQCRWALWAVDHATRYFVHAGDHEQADLTLSERALVLLKLERGAEAARLFERTLERVPAERWRVHASARSGLAVAAEMAGDYPRAAQQLSEAVAVYRGTDFGLASMCWRAGSLARAMGHYDEAVRSLRRTIELLGRFGQPIDVALAAVDLADVFARQGKRHSLRHLGEEVLPWLMKFRHNSWAEAAVGELARLLCHGEVTLPQLAALRRQLQRRS